MLPSFAYRHCSLYAVHRHVTLVRDDNHMLPLVRDDGSSTLVVLFVSDPHGDDGRALEQQVRARMPRAKVVYVDRRSAPLEADAITAMLPNFKHVIAVLYAVPQPGQAGSQTSLDQKTGAVVLQNILAGAADRTAVLAMGSPYPILDYPKIRTYVCAFSSVSTSEEAMARALFGEIRIQGRLPVTLPGVARLGEGLDPRCDSKMIGPTISLEQKTSDAEEAEVMQ